MVAGDSFLPSFLSFTPTAADTHHPFGADFSIAPAAGLFSAISPLQYVQR